MRHHNRNKKFGRTTDVRKAFLRSLIENLLTHGKMTTSLVRAKAIRPIVERYIAMSKKNTVPSKRLVIKSLGTVSRAELLTTAATKTGTRSSGFTRITRLPRRLSDGSERAVIEIITG